MASKWSFLKLLLFEKWCAHLTVTGHRSCIRRCILLGGGRREGLLVDGHRVSALGSTVFDLWGCLLLFVLVACIISVLAFGRQS